MQFKLELIKEKKIGFLPENYRYSLSNAVSKLLDKDENVNQRISSTFKVNPLKYFTFSDLDFDWSETLQQEKVIAHRGEQALLEVRFLIDDGEEEMIRKLLLNQCITLGDTNYKISEIESMPAIEFQDVMTYRCRCPISISDYSSYHKINFLSPDNQDFHKSFKIDLIKRLLRSCPEVPELEGLDQYCPEFQFQLLTEPKRTGITVETSAENFQNFVGYQFDFKLKASPVLHEYGYYEGFGLQHAMGLGFVEIIS